MLQHLHDSWNCFTNQEVLEKIAKEVPLIWSINHNALHDEYAATHGAPLTRGKGLIKIQSLNPTIKAQQ